MKLGSVTKLDKRNMVMLKEFVDDVMSPNCDAIIFFPIYGYLAANREPGSRRMVYKTYILISNNLLSYKNWKLN